MEELCIGYYQNSKYHIYLVDNTFYKILIENAKETTQYTEDGTEDLSDVLDRMKDKIDNYNQLQ